MEKIAKKALMQFLEQHHFLFDIQHGFRSGTFCLTNLLLSLERLTKARYEGDVVYAIYIDFKKAFDRFPHQRLLHKLRNAGMRGRLLARIQSFLTARSQRAQVGCQQFSEVSVVSGVPQSSILDPTLSLGFIKDCAKDLHCGAILFVDEVKLWKVIHNAADGDHLQTNLNRLEDSSKRWFMPFHTAIVALLIMAAWNGRWLLDNPEANRLEIRPVLVTRELSRHIVDMAVLCETRLSEMTQQEEVNFG
nr:unnamed protein product [Spirometra erinaceieuropaei]